VPIATDSLQGSIALKGGAIDDLALVKFREPSIEIAADRAAVAVRQPWPFYANSLTNAAGANVKCRMPYGLETIELGCAQRHEPRPR